MPRRAAAPVPEFP